jgi:hypothetical protein
LTTLGTTLHYARVTQATPSVQLAYRKQEPPPP